MIGRPIQVRSLPLPAIFGDVHDLVLENKQIGRTLAGQPHHVFVVILDTSMHGLAIHQFDRNKLLLLAEIFQEGRFFECIFGRWSSPAFGIGIPVGSAERHARIVHKPELLRIKAELAQTAQTIRSDVVSVQKAVNIKMATSQRRPSNSSGSKI